MSVLAADAAAGDTQLTVDTALAVAVPCSVKIDSELAMVGGVNYRDGLTLALKYPLTADHSSGATVQPVFDAYTSDDSSPFAGGGVQTIRLLGPYKITFADAGLVNPGTEGVEVGPPLDEGTFVIGVYPMGIGSWASGDNPLLEVQVGTEDSAYRIAYWDATSVAGAPGRFAIPLFAGDQFQATRVATTGDRIVLGVWVDTPGSLTAGETDVYVLIAEPA